VNVNAGGSLNLQVFHDGPNDGFRPHWIPLVDYKAPDPMMAGGAHNTWHLREECE
jgi:hypothetical protein